MDSTQKNLTECSWSWDYFTGPNNINTIFSKYGINNYNQKIDSDEKIDPDEKISDSPSFNLFCEQNKSEESDFGYQVINYKKNSKRKNSTEKTQKKMEIQRVIITNPFQTSNVISYGLKVFAQDTKRWVIVQSKHSVEFLLIFRGFYRKTFTKFLLSKITIEESLIIIKCLTEKTDYFINKYLYELKLDSNGLLYALVRMAESRKDILNIISDLDLSMNILPWNWPKGRIKISWIKESIFECAKREFFEEVEINLPAAVMISESYISEQITAITGRNFEFRYWIYVIKNEIELSPPKFNPEVINRLWVDTETCYKMIPQSVSHKKIFDESLNT